MTPDDLVEIELIKQLKYKYQRILDLHEFDEMRTVLTEDVVARYGDGDYSYDGVEAVIGFLKESMDRPEFLSSHSVHHPEITLNGDGTASGIWRLEDQVIMTDHGISLNGAAHYYDRYVKTGDGWRIAETGYRRIFEEMWPRSSVEGLNLTKNGLESTD
ncbi:MAG: nuclear transport factor 2 family protein [Actinomycetota bacterium]